jgi:hypothetical protein
MIPVRHAESALQAIPGCRAVVMSQAGHRPQIDKLVLKLLTTDKLTQENHRVKPMVRL